MWLSAGDKLGPYEILAPLGTGGMGEVYRARDTRLGREVAIKILGSRHAVNPARRDRFLQEARTTSALNHANIVALYDIGNENGADFLVMELVRGKTLDQLAGNRGLGITEALRYAIPIADALARAHSVGILHRDLKPSNIMVTEDGIPKILDFGLAQLTEPESLSEADATWTIQAAHEDGQIAGTPGYMSPEQAEGKKLDARSDIFSFGTVLYEMVTGRRPFRGDSTASTLAAVLRHEPDAPSKLAPNMPRELERIIQRCMRKDPNRRFHSMNDVKVELEEVREESESGVKAAAPGAPRGRRRWLWVGGTVAALAAIGLVGLRLRQRNTVPPPSAPIPLTAYRGDELYADFSPDGNQLVFAWNGEHSNLYHVYVKLIGSPNHLQLTHGEGNDAFPAWSPNGRWIAFQRRDRDGSHTMLVSPIGGPERKVGDRLCGGHMSWSNDSQWLACGASSDSPGLILVRAESGELRRLSSLPKPQFDLDPAFSPDGHNLLFVHCASPDNCDIDLLELNLDLSARGQARRITNEHGYNSGLTWAADGQEAVWSMRKASLRGAASLYRVPVLDAGLPQMLAFGQSADYPVVALRRNRLVYSHIANTYHMWRSDGHVSERHPVSSTQNEGNLRFSPDGKRIAFESDRAGTEAIWVANADGTQPVQLTNLRGHTGSRMVKVFIRRCDMMAVLNESRTQLGTPGGLHHWARKSGVTASERVPCC
jgi:Tol biopolymer transport system component